MHPHLMNICAVIAVHLVTVGAHDVSPDVITKSAPALQLGQGTKHLRTHRSTQDNEEERGTNDIATEMSSMAEGVISASSPGKEDLDQIIKWLFADKDDGKAVDQENLNAYVEDLKKELSDSPTLAESSQRTLAGPVHSTVAEPVYSTVAEPVITRFEDKGPAEFDEVQHGPNVMSGQHQYQERLDEEIINPSDYLKTLKLDKAGENFLGCMGMLTWIKYVDHFNEIPTKKSTTVIAALKKGGGSKKKLWKIWFFHGNSAKKAS
ncbi:unnamed protein product [Peronospora farinosa]|uniref:RxLR effector protein n=1 Tax=Peronospora farinosa TaxID=134698 RepID=A0ABN8C5A5_9STRA|nr:unnamed protein product [Peronospora farinosa]